MLSHVFVLKDKADPIKILQILHCNVDITGVMRGILLLRSVGAIPECNGQWHVLVEFYLYIL